MKLYYNINYDEPRKMYANTVSYYDHDSVKEALECVLT